MTRRNVSCHDFEIVAAKRRSCEALIAPLKSRSVKVANQPSVCTGFWVSLGAGLVGASDFM